MWEGLECADVFIAYIFGRRGFYWEQFVAVDLDHHVGRDLWVAGAFAARCSV